MTAWMYALGPSSNLRIVTSMCQASLGEAEHAQDRCDQLLLGRANVPVAARQQDRGEGRSRVRPPPIHRAHEQLVVAAHEGGDGAAQNVARSLVALEEREVI